MAKSRTVIDLLAEQSEEDLTKMREANRQEVAQVQEELSRLKLEAHQIEQAMARRVRGGARSGRVTNEQVLAAARETEPPFNPPEVKETLAEQGIAASVNTVRNHLKRLHEGGQLVRYADGTYAVNYQPAASDDFPTSPSDDDIPF